MPVAEIELYEALKEKVGGKEVLTTKEDIKTTRDEIKNLEVRIMDEIRRLEVKIEKTKSDIIKCIFLFWIGQLASLIAILQIFFKK